MHRLVPDLFAELLDREGDHYEFRAYRSATAALRVQVGEFFGGLSVVYPGQPSDAALREATRDVTRLALEVDEEHEPHPLSGLNSSVADIFQFMYELDRSIDFNQEFSAGYAPDGSWTIIIGFEMPLLPADELTETEDFDDTKIARAFSVAQTATLLVAWLAVEKKRQEEKDEEY